MTTHCTYCDESVPDEEYEAHLRRSHAEELTAIDRRRVRLSSDDSNGQNLALYTGIGIVLVLFSLGYLLVFLGPGGATSSAAIQPDTANQIHEHGTIVVQYDDTVVAFDDPQYAELDGCFHFHDYDNGEMWHAHCENVTVEYALETLGMDVTSESFSVDGETFSEENGDTISVTANGEEIDPQEYVLQGVESVDDASNGAGDHIEIVVESGD